jgi:hypothetical protein
MRTDSNIRDFLLTQFGLRSPILESRELDMKNIKQIGDGQQGELHTLVQNWPLS